MSDQKSRKPVGSHDRRGRRAEMEVPVNLERVLIEAGKDREFYQALVADRVQAMAERGFSLRASEQAMFSAMPREALDQMIEQLRPENLGKSRFARQVASAVAGTLIISSAACSEDQTKGVGPDLPIDAGADVYTRADGGGAGPDWPIDARADVYTRSDSGGADAGWPRDAAVDSSDDSGGTDKKDGR